MPENVNSLETVSDVIIISISSKPVMLGTVGFNLEKTVTKIFGKWDYLNYKHTHRAKSKFIGGRK